MKSARKAFTKLRESVTTNCMKQDVKTIFRQSEDMCLRGHCWSGIILLSLSNESVGGGKPDPGGLKVPAGWAKLKKVEGNRLLLSFRNEDLEILDPSQWWKQHLGQIKQCLEKGQILAYMESNRIDRLVLQDSVGSKTTLYRPWRLW